MPVSLNLGGFLELATSNNNVYPDSVKDDILFYTDTSSQSLVFGTGPNSNLSAMRISSNTIFFNQNLFFRNMLSVGTSNSVNRVTIYGSNDDVETGPNMAFVSESDPYPLYQILNFHHDDVATNYDCFYDNSNYISSTSNANFQILKANQVLSINAASNIAPGEIIDGNWNNAITINSNAFIGLGTSNIKYRFTILGEDSSDFGPHITAYTTADYDNPVFQQLNLNKDDLSTCYGMYYANGNFVSSSSNANFLFRKQGQSISYYAAYDVPEGETITTFKPSLSLSGFGFLGVGLSNPTSTLTFSGDSNSFFSPIITAYVNSDLTYPVWQQANLNHDDIISAYDNFFDGSNWYSSSSSGNFQIAKQSGRLVFFSACNVSEGNALDSNLFPAMSINSNSFVSLGTSNAVNRLTIRGTDSSMFGPHIAILTDIDDYPVFQKLSWTHDDISTGYDIFYDGSNFVSSTSNGSFLLQKTNGQYSINSVYGVSNGQTVTSNLTPAVVVNSNGFVSIGTKESKYRMTLAGTDSNITGPHTAAYVLSDPTHPVYQQLNWAHDSIFTGYDTYYDGSNYISSSSIANFGISKSKGQFTIYSSCNNVVGAPATLVPSIVVNSNSFVSLYTSNAINRLTVNGDDSSISGPHVAFLSHIDEYPIYQQLNWTHDSISTGYDAFYDGSNWISSSTNANFVLTKTDSALVYGASANNSPGNIFTGSTAMAITSNAFVGFGTSNTSHRITISGDDSSINGPHVAAYVTYDSNYPVFQLYNADHDDISLCFDNFFDGTNFISSDSTNFKISKNDGKLVVHNAHNDTPGSVVNFHTAFSINSNAFIGVGTSNPSARLTIVGSSNSLYGPHVEFFTADDIAHPTLSIVNVAHDDVSLNFDSYWTGSNYVSSASNGNFQVIKQNGKLSFNAGFTSNVASNIVFATALAIQSNSYVGVGNSNASSRLTISGPSNSIAGPHVAFFTYDDATYPTLQHVNLSHDDISTYYDAYFNGSNIISSSSTGNFVITKSNGILAYYASCNAMAGSSIQSNLSLALSINSSGQVNVTTSNFKLGIENANTSDFDIMSSVISYSNIVPNTNITSNFAVNMFSSNNTYGSYSILGSNFVIIASSTLSGSTVPSLAFDNSTTSFWQPNMNYANGSGTYIGGSYTNIHGSNYYGEWLQMQLPFLLNVTGYSIQSYYGNNSNYSANSFYVVGSLDQSNWDLIDAKTGVTSSSNVFSQNVSGSNKVYYNNLRIVLATSISASAPVINSLSFRGNTQSFSSVVRIVTNSNTLYFGNSNQNVSMSNGNLRVSSNLHVENRTTFGGVITVSSNIVPLSNSQYDLGSSNNRFRELWLSGSSINMDGVVLSGGPSYGGFKMTDTNSEPVGLIVKQILLGDAHDPTNSNVFLLQASSNGLSVTQSSSNPNLTSYTQFNNFYITLTGAAIGTSNPSESFDVLTGNAKFHNNEYVLGNFSVGNSNPQEKIDVQGGNAKFANNVYVGDYLGISTSNPSELLEVFGGNAKIGCNLYVMSNVGIGTSNPSEELEVINNVKLDSNLYVSNNVAIGNGFSNPSESLEVVNNVKIDNNLYVLGSLGINTSNPQEILHVSGDVQVDSNVYVTCDLLVRSNAQVGDQLIQTFQKILPPVQNFAQNICTISSTNTAFAMDLKIIQSETSNVIAKGYNFVVTSNATNSNYLRCLPNFTTGTNFGSDFAVDINVSSCNVSLRLVRTMVAGFSNTQSNLSCVLQLAQPDIDSLQIYDDTTSASNTSNLGLYSPNPLVIQQFTSNVGIGLVNPAYKLDVFGGGNFSSNLNVAGTLSNLTDYSLNVTYAQQQSAFIVKNSTGNVGVRTSNPAVIMELNSTDSLLIPQGTSAQRPFVPKQGHIRYNTSLAQFEGFGPGSVWGSLGGVKSTDGATYISAEYASGCNDNTLRFYTSNIARMIVNSNGNIGIGTSNPQALLEVDGNASFASNLYVGGGFSMNGFYLADGIFPSNIFNTFVNLNAGGAANSGFNCGINIEENTQITGYIQTSLDRSSYLLKTPAGSQMSLMLASNIVSFNSNVLVLSNTSIGIGTQTPNFTLDVVGSVNSTSYFLNGSPFLGGGTYGYVTSISSNAFVTSNFGVGTSNITSPFTVAVNSAFSCNVAVSSNLYVNNVIASNAISSNLTVYNTFSNLGTAYFASNVAINGIQSNLNNASFASNVVVASNLYVNNNTVHFNTTSNLGNAYFASNVVMSNVFVNNIVVSNVSSNLGNAYFASNVYSSNVYVTNVIVSNATSNLGNAYFASNVVASNLYATNVTTCNVLSNLGSAYFASNVVINGIFSNLNNTYIASNLTIGNNLYIQGNLSFASNTLNVYFGCNVVINQTLSNYGNASFSSNTIVNGIFSNLGSAYFASNVAINGTLTVSNVEYITSNITVYSSEIIQSNLTVQNIFSNMGNASFSSNVVVNGTLSNNNNSYFASTTTNFFSNMSLAYFASNVVIKTLTASNATTSNLMVNTLNVSGISSYLSNVNFNNFIAVGTSNVPNYTVDVAGDLNITGNLRRNGVAVSLGATTGNFSNGPYGLYTPCNVAINKTNPSCTFDVNGKINSVSLTSTEVISKKNIYATNSSTATSTQISQFLAKPWYVNAQGTYNFVFVTHVLELNAFFCLSSTGIVTSADGYRFSSVIAPNYSYTCAAYSPSLGMLVVTASGGQVVYSTNGVNFYVSTAPSHAWSGACFSQSLNIFVIVSSDGYIAYSSDGVTFTSATCPSYSYSSACWSTPNSIFVCVTSDGHVCYSSNGVSWTAGTCPVNSYNSVCYSDVSNVFVACGTNTVMTSSTGTSWTAGTIANYNWSCVIYSDCLGLFVLAASNGVNTSIATSADGVIYTLRTTTSSVSSVSFSSSLGVGLAVGNNGVTMTNKIIRPTTKVLDVRQRATFSGALQSPITTILSRQIVSRWYTQTAASNVTFTSVVEASGIGLIVAISSDGGSNQIQTSANAGQNWTLQSTPANNGWTSLCYSIERNLLVACAMSGGSNNRIMVSSNASSWSTQITNSNLWNGVCYSPSLDLFVSVGYDTSMGNSNVMVMSSNVWSLRGTANNNNYQSICWSDELGIFAMVSDSGVGNRVQTSVDATNWTQQVSAADNQWSSIAWSPLLNCFAACSTTGSGNQIQTSSDGVNWSLQSTPVGSYQFNSITWSDIGSFVVVGISSTSYNILSSTDSKTWVFRTSPINSSLMSVCYSRLNQAFVSVGAMGSIQTTIL